MDQVIIETSRLILRPFYREDAGKVQALAGDKRVSETTLHIPHPYLDGMAEQWIAGHPACWQQKTAVIYAITGKTGGSLMGTVSLVDIQGDQAELGYWLGIDYWGQGYCTEAAKALADFAFSELGINSLIADHLSENPASGKVMEKIGMQYQHNSQKLDRHNRLAEVKVYRLEKVRGTF
ncbi:GNAT family N-acetyltransferase [Thalassomonas viridans]|uniref:GNAT family N-acetyltransferase n=1 Tax=Thalassomonas viridans TaxID=137584 RepID=A0AAE9Z3A9_9GAMM|nr:GNAT family N-acetyltransferase [Thalassomonas viridans]WDE05778.1 GNAT family N-acetyltransferase [Thalassomonas viridans]